MLRFGLVQATCKATRDVILNLAKTKRAISAVAATGTTGHITMFYKRIRPCKAMGIHVQLIRGGRARTEYSMEWINAEQVLPKRPMAV